LVLDGLGARVVVEDDATDPLPTSVLEFLHDALRSGQFGEPPQVRTIHLALPGVHLVGEALGHLYRVPRSGLDEDIQHTVLRCKIEQLRAQLVSEQRLALVLRTEISTVVERRRLVELAQQEWLHIPCVLFVELVTAVFASRCCFR